MEILLGPPSSTVTLSVISDFVRSSKYFVGERYLHNINENIIITKLYVRMRNYNIKGTGNYY